MAKTKRSTARPRPATRAAAPPAAAATPATRSQAPGYKVRAIQDGYQDNQYRRVGAVFTIGSAKEFSARWMEYVDGATPDRHIGSNAAIAAQHDATLAQKLADAKADTAGATGDANPLGD